MSSVTDSNHAIRTAYNFNSKAKRVNKENASSITTAVSVAGTVHHSNGDVDNTLTKEDIYFPVMFFFLLNGNRVLGYHDIYTHFPTANIRHYNSHITFDSLLRRN